MVKLWGRIGLTFAMVIALLFVSACTEEEKSGAAPTSSRSSTSKVSFSNDYNKDDTWLVYWYLCGTDLESDYGASTLDLSELVEAKLPPNVKILVQTGGAAEWQNEIVPNGQIARIWVRKIR